LVATESVFTASTMRTRGLRMTIISSLEQSKSQHSFKNRMTCLQKTVSKEKFALLLFLWIHKPTVKHSVWLMDVLYYTIM
jgi:hypothetical protein